MNAGVGDRIVVESERVAQPGRARVIKEVLDEDPPRFRVLWDDGRTSIFAPSAGVARIEQRKEERGEGWGGGVKGGWGGGRGALGGEDGGKTQARRAVRGRAARARAPAERAIRSHRYLDALAAGRLPESSLGASAGEQFSIISSDPRSFAHLSGPFPES